MRILELLKVILLGVVEGLSEWIPISSTGHMILVDEFIKLNITPEFKELFLVVIQLGAIMAVVILFWKKLFPFDFSDIKKGFIIKDKFDLWIKIIVACLPAGVIGVLFDDWFDKHFYNWYVVSFTLVFYGILFILIENLNKGKEPRIKKIENLSYKTVLLIGFFQILAIIPGTSRSGATILGAMLIGTSRYVATEFTFYLAIPVMFGAGLVKLMKFGLVFTMQELLILLIGMLTALLVSIIAIKFLLSYIKKKDFKIFGWYRIVLGLLMFLYFFMIK
jgi:undecaprenyl-diphosphatase UppP